MEQDIPFIAMEFLEGESLDQLIQRRPNLPLAQKIGYMVAVCRALDYAHTSRIIHRDMKPGNVMLTREGVVKVLDFGIARLMDVTGTQVGTLIGTFGYMSPEQIQGQRADERSDIWASGTMFYELLCYQRPFNGDNQAQLMLNIISETKQPPPIRELAPDCPPELQAVIERMLQKQVDRRFQTMGEVLLELEPLWKRFQEDAVLALIADSESLISRQNLLGAQNVLREALQINPATPARESFWRA